MDFLVNNYIIIILVGLFIVFSLIGYLGETIKKNRTIEKNEIMEDIKPIEDTDIPTEKEIVTISDEINTNDKQINININNSDDLLEDYDKGN